MLAQLKAIWDKVCLALLGLLAAVGLYYKDKAEEAAGQAAEAEAQVVTATAAAQIQQDTQDVAAADAGFEAAVKDYTNKGGK